jgi:5-methyltetrahydropteroyltriglutamate--homocysteine methyltransferase
MVVGSYPAPDWLRAYPTRDHLRDATVVVVRAQELAGIDVISDGELSRFDVNHPETNGMIDYFVGQMDGVRVRITAADAEAFAGQQGMAYRTAPAAVVVDQLGPGTLDLAAAARLLRQLTTGRTKFTVTSPYMLAKVLLDRHYGDRQALSLALADVLRDQLRRVDADVIQVDEANLAGNPEDAAPAAEAINRVLDGVPAGAERALHLCFGNYGGQTIQKGSSTSRTSKLRRPTKSPGALSTPNECSAPAGCATPTPTAGCGCSPARSPAPSSAPWPPGETGTWATEQRTG